LKSATFTVAIKTKRIRYAALIVVHSSTDGRVFSGTGKLVSGSAVFRSGPGTLFGPGRRVRSASFPNTPNARNKKRKIIARASGFARKDELRDLPSFAVESTKQKIKYTDVDYRIPIRRLLRKYYPYNNRPSLKINTRSLQIIKRAYNNETYELLRTYAVHDVLFRCTR